MATAAAEIVLLSSESEIVARKSSSTPLYFWVFSGSQGNSSFKQTPTSGLFADCFVSDQDLNVFRGIL